MIKTIIANYGVAGVGKTSSIRKVYDMIKESYHHTISDITDLGKDIRAIIYLTDYGIKIGLESQGDPESRMEGSMDFFVKESCDIIIAACRTKGSTLRKISEVKKKGYTIIWAKNFIMDDRNIRYELLNEIYATSVLSIVQGILSGDIDRTDNNKSINSI